MYKQIRLVSGLFSLFFFVVVIRIKNVFDIITNTYISMIASIKSTAITEMNMLKTIDFNVLTL